MTNDAPPNNRQQAHDLPHIKSRQGDQRILICSVLTVVSSVLGLLIRQHFGHMAAWWFVAVLIASVISYAAISAGSLFKERRHKR
jgi:hypothetical protein